MAAEDPFAPDSGIDTQVPPSGPGCAECLAGEGPGWWVHLRRCAQCGHVGCCDSSLSRHATAHFEATGHRWMSSFEPGEDWFHDYVTEETHPAGPALAEPTAYPPGQPAPGPEGKVPADWRAQLRR